MIGYTLILAATLSSCIAAIMAETVVGKVVLATSQSSACAF